MARRKPQPLTTNTEIKHQVSLAVNELLLDTFSRFNFMSGLGVTHEGARDMYDVCGWPRQLVFQHYLNMYERGGIAARVVNAPCDTCWKKPPRLYEDTGVDVLPGETRGLTPFEEDWQYLVEELDLLRHLYEADKRSRIGRFGILLIGVSVKRFGRLDQPLRDGMLRNPQDILYFNTFHEGRVKEIIGNVDRESPQFGLPEFYDIEFGSDVPGFTMPGETLQRVHASRVIHIAETALENDVFAQPAMKGIYNNLENIEKVVGGAAEMFFQGARRTLHFKVNPEAHFGPEERARIEDHIYALIHNLKASIVSQGGEVETLASITPDPTGNFHVNLQIISGHTNIPQRKLVGSEQGELASSQDEHNWNDFCQSRNANYTGPRLVLRTGTRLIALGACRPAVHPLLCEWEDLLAMSAMEKAQLGKIQTEAIVAYSNALNATSVVPEQEFRVKILDWDPEAPAAAIKAQEEKDKEDALDETDPEVQDQFQQGQQPADDEDEEEEAA